MLILDVWREVSRHRELGETVERIAELLPPELPSSTLVLRRFEAGRVRTAALARSAAWDAAVLPPEPSARAEELSAWCRAGRVARHRAEALPSPLDAAVPPGLSGDVMVGPLLAGGEPIGVVVLAARSYGAVHESAAQRLLEPLAAALQNDARLRDLRRAREALEAERNALAERLERLDLSPVVVGAEGGMAGVMGRVRQVAPGGAPVLLLGEYGTGKSLVAREIHRRSGRAAGPLVRVDCGGLAPGRADAVLFGHERGSIAGEPGDQAGAAERADGGTLYLTEPETLPPDTQEALLRLIREGSFKRVGAQRPVRVDVRVVASTHHEPLALVQQGRLREDLWYALGTAPVRLPALRERTADLPALAEHFARSAGGGSAGAPLRPSAEDLATLVRYPWPGNVAELAAVIRRAAVLGGGRRLEVAAALGGSPVTAQETEGAAEVMPLDAAMARHIEEALAACRGRVEGPRGAAALLGINPHTLRSRMRKLRVDWGRFRVSAGS